MKFIFDTLKAIVSPITNVFRDREERKKVAISAKAKVEQIKITGDQTIQLTDAEWESLSVQTQHQSWKDEYVTLVITSPIVGLLGGSVYAALTGDIRVVEGFSEGLKLLKDLEVPMGDLMTAVVLAAVGLKLWRNK